MQAVQIDELELFEGWSQSDTGMRVRAGFPISSGTGTKSTAVVYFELEPGEHLGSHTDSAEEILLVVAGKGEATIGEEQAAVQTGTLAVVPALVPSQREEHRRRDAPSRRLLLEQHRPLDLRRPDGALRNPLFHDPDDRRRSTGRRLDLTEVPREAGLCPAALFNVSRTRLQSGRTSWPRVSAGFPAAGMRPARFELATSASAGQRSIP